jgi:hypothetical protein
VLERAVVLGVVVGAAAVDADEHGYLVACRLGMRQRSAATILRRVT